MNNTNEYSKSSNEVVELVQDTFKKNEFDNFDVKITGTTADGDGYTGEIWFIHVLTCKKNEEQKEFDIVVKVSQNKNINRKLLEIAYKTEIYFYKTLLPQFNKYIASKGLKQIDFAPKCYKVFELKDKEVVMLENMKMKGYDVQNRLTPLNFEHTKLVMEAYGKYHAISFALRDQDPKQFHDLCETRTWPWTYFGETFKNHIEWVILKVKKVLMDHKELSLLQKYNEKLADGAYNLWTNLVNLKVEKSVFLHGDCWNNNFMFTYQEDDDKKVLPTKVCILDFQLAGVYSPVFDLSYHIYSACSPESLDNHFIDHLKLYYESLSESLKELGSDPKQLFSYKELLDHWKNYSGLGFIMGHLILYQFVNQINQMEESENKEYLQKLTQRRIIAMVRNAVEETPNL